MSRINVLWMIDHICYDGSLHGGGRLYWNVLPRFDSNRFRVVPCMLRASDEVREVMKQSPVPVRILDKGKYDLTTLTTFLRLLKEEAIDVMHLHCYASSTFGRLASAMTGVPAIIHDYDTAVYFPYPPYLWVMDRLLSPVTRRAVAASPLVRDYFVGRRRVSPDKVSMAFHAVPMEKFAPVSRDRVAKVRSELGIEEGARVVGTVTKLGPERGNHLLLRAAADVIAKSPEEVVFVIAYKKTLFHRRPDEAVVDLASAETDSDGSDLRSLARELGIEKNVRLVESPENVDELMAAFDLFVAPFLSDRFSSVNVLEAMALGRPVIATDIGEQTEILEDRQNGALVPVGDQAALAARIAELLSDPEELERLGRGARATAERNSVDAYVRRLEGWYAELVAKPGTEVAEAVRG